MRVVLDNLDVFRSGLWLTVRLTGLSFVFALVVGTSVATMRISPAAPLRAAGLIYVGTIRDTPLLMLLVFGFPKIGVTYSLFAWAVIVFSAYTAPSSPKRCAPGSTRSPSARPRRPTRSGYVRTDTTVYRTAAGVPLNTPTVAVVAGLLAFAAGALWPGGR